MYQSTIPPIEIEAFEPTEIMMAQDRLADHYTSCEAQVADKASPNRHALVARFQMIDFLLEQLARGEDVEFSRDGVIRHTKQRIKSAYSSDASSVPSDRKFHDVLLNAWSEVVVIVRV